jgi:hypothetical protein
MYQAQVATPSSKKAYDILQHRPCLWKLIVACSDNRSRTDTAGGSTSGALPADLDRLVTPEEGTWVLGDEATTNANPPNPKIFTHFGGAYNCSTGEEITPPKLRDITLATIQSYTKGADAGWNATVCWGNLLDPSGVMTGPIPHLPCCKSKLEAAGSCAMC